MTSINKIGTERSMQVRRVSEGSVQLAGFQRNQDEFDRSKEASIKSREVFHGIEDSQEENDAHKPVLDSSLTGLLQFLIKTIIVKTKTSTNSGQTSYFDRGWARTGAQISQDWIVVPKLGGGLRGS